MGNERRELSQIWENGSYEQAFAISREKLDAKPMDYFLLTLHGFSAYQLAAAQINYFDTQTYLDECIWSLRKARLSKEGADDPRIPYVLGKAYYLKGAGYADQAVKFLEEAQNGDYQTGDLPEYLGLAYTEIHDFRSSVAALSTVLNANTDTDEELKSDLVLVAIARSYMALEEPGLARAYLVRCVETSLDSDTKVAARLLLAESFAAAGDVAEAEAQYLLLLEAEGENAEAHFQLGELYAAGRDTTRARAEWRKAWRIDPAHKEARSRLNL
ncbi:hypothetical protein FACS189483_11000 [Spirochaetia bacterium]|nr:hypothetical protein FACS189483_11000 [Spirochaetia bacterium]